MGQRGTLRAINPEQEPYRTQPGQANITALDLTKLKAGDALNHGRFAASPKVVQLIGLPLAEGPTAADCRVGLGDRITKVTAGAATAVGTTGGLAVSTPVTLIDPQIWQSLGDQVEGLGQFALRPMPWRRSHQAHES